MRIRINKTVAKKAKRGLSKSSLGVVLFKLKNRNKKQFICPICKYNGPFADAHDITGIRKHAVCPKCRSLERHRLQYLVVKKLAMEYDFSKLSMIHFAPEPFFRQHFKESFRNYNTADLTMENVDFQTDLLNLHFEDELFDFVFASHILEHIKEDSRALSEIRRILRPGGIAVLPVPIVAHKTVEYPESNPHEFGHVRAPGADYFEKYSLYFSKVETFDSNDFPAKYQVFIYEDRTGWPTENIPLRPAMEGNKHLDIVPVCFV